MKVLFTKGMIPADFLGDPTGIRIGHALPNAPCEWRTHSRKLWALFLAAIAAVELFLQRRRPGPPRPTTRRRYRPRSPMPRTIPDPCRAATPTRRRPPVLSWDVQALFWVSSNAPAGPPERRRSAVAHLRRQISSTELSAIAAKKKRPTASYCQSVTRTVRLRGHVQFPRKSAAIIPFVNKSLTSEPSHRLDYQFVNELGSLGERRRTIWRGEQD